MLNKDDRRDGCREVEIEAYKRKTIHNQLLFCSRLHEKWSLHCSHARVVAASLYYVVGINGVH